VVARLRVILRRTGRGVEEPRNAKLTFADIELDEDTHEVWKAGEPVSLSPDRVPRCSGTSSSTRAPYFRSPRSSTMCGVMTSVADVNVVESYVSYLRRKVGHRRKSVLLHTLRGVG